MPVNKILSMHLSLAKQVLLIDIKGYYLYSLTSKKGKNIQQNKSPEKDVYVHKQADQKSSGSS